jgi:hypothetical protein
MIPRPTLPERSNRNRPRGLVREGRARISGAVEDPIAVGTGSGGLEEPWQRGQVLQGYPAPVLADGGRLDSIRDARQQEEDMAEEISVEAGWRSYAMTSRSALAA